MKNNIKFKIIINIIVVTLIIIISILYANNFYLLSEIPNGLLNFIFVIWFIPVFLLINIDKIKYKVLVGLITTIVTIFILSDSLVQEMFIDKYTKNHFFVSPDNSNTIVIQQYRHHDRDGIFVYKKYGFLMKKYIANNLQISVEDTEKVEVSVDNCTLEWIDNEHFIVYFWEYSDLDKKYIKKDMST